jgi:hypothetical protein
LSRESRARTVAVRVASAAAEDQADADQQRHQQRDHQRELPVQREQHDPSSTRCFTKSKPSVTSPR